MLHSKKVDSMRTLIVWMGFILLVSCSVKGPQDRPSYNENGSFYVSKVASNGTTVINESVYGFPIKKIFNIEICFKDLATKKEVIRQDFEISNGKDSKLIKTNSNGCLVYPDQIAFNYLTYESHYVHLKRTITAKGGQRGFQEINYAVNPWGRSKAEETFYDLDKGDKPPRLIEPQNVENALKGVGLKKAKLWVEKVDNLMLSSGNITEDGYSSRLELHISPEIKFLDINGDTVFYKIKKGLFIVKPYLINKKTTAIVLEDKKVISIIPKEEQMKPVEMFDHKIKLERDINIPVVPNRGEIEVGLMVNLIGDNDFLKDKIKEFYGVYYLSQADQLSGRKNGSLSAVSTGKLFSKDTYDFTLSEYCDDLEGTFVQKLFKTYVEHGKRIEKATQNGEKLNDSDLLPFETDSDWRINRYVVSVKAPKFQSYGKISLPTLDVNYNASVCIKDPFSGFKPLRNQTFTIHSAYQDENGKRSKIKRTTQEDGCFSWPDRLTFKAYDKEHYHIQYFILENEELGFKESHGVAINPWDFGFTFGFPLVERKDLLEGGQDLDKKPPSTVFIPDFSYRNLGFDYIIDEHLNLTLRKHLILRIHPDYQAFHSITRLKPVWPLYPGKYLLKAVLMRNFYEDIYHAGEYISHVTKFVEVNYGRIITDVTFEIDDIRLMGSRNLIMIEIFPVYEDLLVIDSEGQIVPKDKELRADKTKKSWDNLIAFDSGLVSKPHIGPIMILNETEAGPVLPNDQKNMINSLNSNDWDKLLKSLTPKKREEFLKNVHIKLQKPRYDKITSKDFEQINKSNGDNYISSSALPEYLKLAKEEMDYGFSEKKTEVRYKYEKSNVRNENGEILSGLDKTDPRVIQGGLSTAGSSTNSIVPEELYIFGGVEADSEASFIGSSYEEGMKKLIKVLNLGEGYDENGERIFKSVNIDDLESNPNYQDSKMGGISDELIPIKYYDERSKQEKTGYAPPRFDITTTRMIERGEKIIESKRALAKEASQIKYFLLQNHLDYLELSNHDQIEEFLFRLANPLWHKREHKRFKQYMSGQLHAFPFPSELNSEATQAFSNKELKKFVLTGEMSGDLMRALCKYWFYDYSRNLYGMDPFKPIGRNIPMYNLEVAHEILPQSHYDAANLCMSFVKEPSHAFVVERKIRAHSVRSFEHQKGLSVNMSVNSGVKWGFGESTSKSNSIKLDFTSSLDKFVPISLPFNITAGKTLSLTRSRAYSNGTDEGTGNSVNLVVQRNEFELTFDKYEHCVSVKLNPAAFNLSPDPQVFFKRSGIEVYWNDQLSDENKSDFLNRGLFICTGEVIEKEIKVPENYYYITQHFNVGHSFDMPSIKNRWFDVALRGEQTLTVFSSLLYAQQYEAADQRVIQTPIGRINDPLFALLPIYSKLPTSFNGIYSLPVDSKTFLGFNWRLDGPK